MSISKKVFFSCLLSVSLYGCAEIFNGAVLPNQCKKCELLDMDTGEVLFVLEGCGSENTNLEGECKEEAWELSRVGNICNMDIRCDSWRKEKE